MQRRRWLSCWHLYWCFGSHKHRKRIGHAVLVPETTAVRSDVPEAGNPIQAPAITLPFVAPPSSPASFLQSEPPSVTQSPAGLSLSVSANMYSPGGPASIFAIGPYAHETQLVSPPVFSTFTTEPSTAPFTPPPESVHLTTPSSPEVPFAQLLDPNLQNGGSGLRFPLSHYEFNSYQLHPGSPVGQLISPNSGISGSGTSSPFPDGEFSAGTLLFPEFRMGDPPKLLKLDKFSRCEWGPVQGSGTLASDAVKLTPCNGFLLNPQISMVPSNPPPGSGCCNNQIVVDHRVSFELTSENVVRCVEKNPRTLSGDVPKSLHNEAAVKRQEKSSEVIDNSEHSLGETSNGTPVEAPENGEDTAQQQKHGSMTLSTIKEFNFDNIDGRDSHKSIAGSDWWANEKVVGKESGPTRNWSFFPVMQPGVS